MKNESSIRSISYGREDISGEERDDQMKRLLGENDGEVEGNENDERAQE